MSGRYVAKNEGCNRTDIEGHFKMPQARLRRVLSASAC